MVNRESMKFVSEQEIDSASEKLHEEGVLDQVLSEFENEQPWLLAFMTADAGPALSADEQDHMMFLALSVWLSLDQDERKALVPLQAQAIEEAEEKIWTLIQEGGNRSFSGLLDSFFERTTQEDLLAFVEDALQLDEDSPVTSIGREVVVVRLLVMIDLLCEDPPN